MRHRKEETSGLFRISQQRRLPDETVESSAIYECSLCLGITAFKKDEKFTLCPDCKGKRTAWYQTDDFVHFVSKNLNTEYARLETWSFKIAQWITEFAGSTSCVIAHVVWFALWIWMNTGHALFGIADFDPYPFPFLVLVVSLEAIFLALFILVSQNIQGKRSDIRAEIDYQVNLKTEKDTAEALSVLNDIRAGKLILKGKRIVLDEKK